MKAPDPSFAVHFDAANPGHALACCGLLELAHRLWRDVEGCFDQSRFVIVVQDGSDDHLQRLVKELASSDITGLTEEEQSERKALEAKKRREQLTPEDERRRRELGEKARAGAIELGRPFNLNLDWWNDDAAPKTWAGRQELRRVAESAQKALADLQRMDHLLDHAAVLRTSDGKKVEPFYFDARRFVHALDTGFSLDAQDVETMAHPAVELLALIGLQRFRPITTESERGMFDYWLWDRPLGVATAAACFAGFVTLSGRRRYRFSLRFRDDQRRYKAFGFARPYGGDT